MGFYGQNVVTQVTTCSHFAQLNLSHICFSLHYINTTHSVNYHLQLDKQLSNFLVFHILIADRRICHICA